MDITFLGATGTVTGSKYLVETRTGRILVDCGLFQGLKELRLRNWAPLPVRADSVDAVVLTHAHLDHSGYLPPLIRAGFAGRVFTTQGTRDLCGLLLPDSGHLQEEDARFANHKGFSRHHPAQPLYTQREAEDSLRRFTPTGWNERVYVGGGLHVEFRRAGHILGAASVRVDDGLTSVVFSGDLGRPRDPVLLAPAPPADADYLVVESTYGDRRHDAADPADQLAQIVGRAAARGGSVLLPTFAVGRAQTLLFYLQQLRASGRIPALPVFLNSPMASSATELYFRSPEEHRLDEATCRALRGFAEEVTTVEQSRALNERRDPVIILAASGMLTGGRVLHHLESLGPDPRNIIVLVGYQAAGTRGASLARGDRALTVHGAPVPIRAEVVPLHTLSAHADADELLGWLGAAPRPPRRVFVTHGELPASLALSARIERELGWRCTVPAYKERFSTEAT